MANYNNSSEMRPFSDNLVDLHISVVPMNHWVEKLNYASHKVIGDTFSAGFIRVLPETSVAMLRQEISEQLGSEIFPENYVFLKHVGRCLDLIRQSQEKSLKVKHFLPPHSVMPEIYVLPGQPAMYTYKVLPPIQPRLRDLHISFSDNSGSATNLKTNDSANRSLHTKSPYKYNDIDLASRNSTNSPEANNIPLRQSFNSFRHENHAAEGQLKQMRAPNSPPKTRIPSSVQRRELKRQQRHVSGKSNYDIEVGQTVSYSYEQDPYPLHEKDQSGGEETLIMQKSSPSQPEETTPSLAKSVLREGPKKRRVRYNMPPQSNASSQDNELPGGVDLSATHALSHSDHRRYFNHSSGSASSLRSNPLDEHEPDFLPPNRYDINFNRNGHVRKQFIDTSSHAFSNPSDHSLGSNQNHFVPNSDPVVSPSPLSPTPAAAQTARFNPDSNFANGIPHPESYHAAPSKKPENEPPTGEKRKGRDLTKSSSANNDSGYVEHELSDSDEYFFKEKPERSTIKKTGQGAELHVDSDHGDVREDELVRVGQHVSEIHDNETISHSSIAVEKSKESAVYIATTKTSVGEQKNDSGSNGQARAEDSPSLHENQRSINQTFGSDLSQNALSPHVGYESEPNNPEDPKRILSQDSSYQYDFYGRSGPSHPIDSQSPSGDGLRSPHEAEKSSSDPEEGSKLSYRLSRNGYRVKSSGNSATQAEESSYRQENAENSYFAAQEDHQLHTSSQFESRDNHDDDLESDNEGYQSSLDEFEKELANLTRQAANAAQENALEKVPDHMVETRKEEIITAATGNVIPFEENVENPRTFSSQGGRVLKRDSISGSSIRSETAAMDPTAEVVAHAATASFETESVDILKFPAENDRKKLLDDELLLESGQSRGAPDGMPTQRKINTGGSDKPDKPLIGTIIPPETYVVGNVERQTTLQKPESVDKKPKKYMPNQSEPVHSSFKANKDSTVAEKRTVSPPHQLNISEKNNKTEQNDLIQITSPVSPSVLVPQFKQLEVEKEEISKPDSPLQSLQSNQQTSDVPIENSKSSSTAEASDVQVEKRLESPARAQLWEELQRIRAERRKAEKQRQELVQQAKFVTSRMNQKRSSVRDLWKKKFFEEKKKTLPLEETCRRLQGELESTHRRLVTALETNKPNHQLKKLPPIHLPPPIFAPSTKIRRTSLRTLQKNNNKIQATRLEHDMDSLRRQIEDAKIKLTGEIKLRHRAEQDVKTMRQELLTKKIRAHIAYRELSRNRLQYTIKA